MTRGLLQEIKLAELIQLVSMSDRTGVLELTPLHPAQHATTRPIMGQIFFREGQPYAASLAERTGMAAAENLFLWEAGFFAFRLLEWTDLPPQPNFTERDNTAALMLRGLDRLATWTTARTLVPTLRAVLHRKEARADRPGFTPDTPEGQMLALCDGRRQLEDVAQQLGLGRIRCREVAAHLLTTEHVCYGPLSLGEQLTRVIAINTLPTLGVAADLFADHALRTMHIAPEQLEAVRDLDVAAVQGVIAALTRAVATTLDGMRAGALARHLCHTLEVPLLSPEVHHV